MDRIACDLGNVWFWQMGYDGHEWFATWMVCDLANWLADRFLFVLTWEQHGKCFSVFGSSVGAAQ
jgi:hypothetical protein